MTNNEELVSGLRTIPQYIAYARRVGLYLESQDFTWDEEYCGYFIDGMDPQDWIHDMVAE